MDCKSGRRFPSPCKQRGQIFSRRRHMEIRLCHTRLWIGSGISQLRTINTTGRLVTSEILPHSPRGFRRASVDRFYASIQFDPISWVEWFLDRLMLLWFEGETSYWWPCCLYSFQYRNTTTTGSNVHVLHSRSIYSALSRLHVYSLRNKS